jgi:hypothetical protein
MTQNSKLQKCLITDEPVRIVKEKMDLLEYQVEYYDTNFQFCFESAHQNSNKVNRNKYILKGLLLNNKFPQTTIYTNEYLEKVIDEAVIPNTPKEKIDELLLFLYANQDHTGSVINVINEMPHDILLCRLYLKSNSEFMFFMKTLHEMKYVSYVETSSIDGFSVISLRLTFQGLEYIIGLEEEGAKSKDCFIAMSFSETQNETKEAIRTIVSQCGFNPILINEVNYESDITINDAIIRYIKKSKFLIADFTEQKAGVYFESGFALGKGKPVIYMCSAADFDNLHFDTNHYPHIKYENIETMKKMLEDKIKAWID